MTERSFYRWAIRCQFYYRGKLRKSSFMGKYGLLVRECGYEDLRLSLPICHFETRKEARVVASRYRDWPLRSDGWGVAATPVKVLVRVEEI